MAMLWELTNKAKGEIAGFLAAYDKNYQALCAEQKHVHFASVLSALETKACNLAHGDSCVVFEVRAVESATGKVETRYLYPDDFEAFEVEE